MKQNKFPAGWDEERVRQLLARYEDQTEAEAIAEDEAAFADQSEIVMGVPRDLVPLVRELIAKHQQ
jgi:aminoglycoside/choline kinase family phosphotransferase